MYTVDQVKYFHMKLEIADTKTVFTEAMFEIFCGTGPDVTGTKYTNPSKWPGDKKLELVVKKAAAAKWGRRLRSV